MSFHPGYYDKLLMLLQEFNVLHKLVVVLDVVSPSSKYAVIQAKCINIKFSKAKVISLATLGQMRSLISWIIKVILLILPKSASNYRKENGGFWENKLYFEMNATKKRKHLKFTHVSRVYTKKQ